MTRRFQKLISFRRSTRLLLILSNLMCTPLVMAHGDLDLQIFELGKLLKTNPNDGRLYLKRGELHRRHLQWAEALKDYQFAEAYGISGEELDFYRGRMYRESSQNNLAILFLGARLESTPEDIEALVERSKIPSRPALDSVKDLDRALELSPHPSPDMYLSRAQLTASMGSEYLQQTVDGLSQGVERLGPLVALIEFSVSEYERYLQWQSALDQINLLPQIVSKSPTWLIRAADLNYRLKRFKDAQTLFLKARQVIISLPPARKNTPAMLDKQTLIEQGLQKVDSQSNNN